MGKSQEFDPLEFLISESHKRGILVHAWFNPCRSFHPAAKTISANHVFENPAVDGAPVRTNLIMEDGGKAYLRARWKERGARKAF